MMFAAAVVLAGCNRRTPEERLEKAKEFIQQNDTLSAEVEAKKIIEKTPDDPIAIQARILLAQIYARDQRYDEARSELEPALDKVSQKDALGKAVLKTYLLVLQREKKFDEAIKTIDQFQQKYADDEGTSLNLTVARADIQTVAGQTTAARESLMRLHDTTTSPAEIELYRGMIGSTFQRDGDTTGGIQFYEHELASVKSNDQKRGLISQLAEMYAAVDNYEKTREYAMQATTMYDDLMTSDIDARLKGPLTFDLARMYVSISNLGGARRALQALFDSAPQDPQLIMATVAGLFEALVRQGDADAAIGFLKEASTRYPTAPFAQQAAQMEAAKNQGKMANAEDTSTLALKFAKEPIVPKNLPKPAETSGTVTVAAGATSGTVVQEATTSGSSAGAAAVPARAGDAATTSADATTSGS
jgi:tetratricopeptide (TPR) repeat protein